MTARGSATALRFVADPRHSSQRTGEQNQDVEICNPCPKTFLLPISPAGHLTSRQRFPHDLRMVLGNTNERLCCA